MFLHILITIGSLYMLILGAGWILQGAVSIAEKFKISKLVIASTLIAFGTGLPTIAVNIALVLVNNTGIDTAVGNALGTNFVNIGLALGIPAIMTVIKTKYEIFEKEIPLYLAFTGLFTAFFLDMSLSRFEGVLLILFYIITLYIVYQYSIREKTNQSEDTQFDLNTSTIQTTPTDNISLSKSIFLVASGLFCLTVFSILLAFTAPLLSRDLNISEYVIGLTIIGIGTSLPTIVTSIRAAKKGYIDIILGNVFGGTIANIALGLGLPAVFRQLSINSEAVSDTYFFNILNIFVIFGILIESKILKKENKALGRISGIIIVSLYMIYLVSKLI